MPLSQPDQVGISEYVAMLTHVTLQQGIHYCTSGQVWTQVHLRPHNQPVTMTMSALP